MEERCDLAIGVDHGVRQEYQQSHGASEEDTDIPLSEYWLICLPAPAA